MSCTEAAALLNDYIDDALPPGARQGTRAHLDDCPRCQNALKELRCTRRLLRTLPREPMPDNLKAALLDAYRTRQHPKSSPPAPPHNATSESSD